MADYYEIIGNDGANHRVRLNPDVRSAILNYPGTTNLVNITNSIKAEAGASELDVYVYTADVPDSNIVGGYAARAGDKWRRVYKVGTTLVSGWTAEKHLGIVQGITITPITNPAPPKHVIEVYVDGVLAFKKELE